MTKPNDTNEPSPASAGSHGADITTRLRRWTHSVDAVFASDIMDEAADEIERLRVNLRLADAGFTLGSPALTDEERAAIALAKSRLGTSDGDWQADDVLAALLKRLG
jgi:hypothetical protein